MIEGLTQHLNFLDTILVILSLILIWLAWQARGIIAQVDNVEEDLTEYKKLQEKEIKFLYERITTVEQKESQRFENIYNELRIINKSVSFIQGHLEGVRKELSK